MWLKITILITKLITKFIRLFGGHGTALPGLVAEQLYPNILGKLMRQLEGGVLIVTGTNGKTTTCKIVRKMFEADGLKVLANRSGSNFTRGIIASVIEHTNWQGLLDYDVAVLEVDEAYTPRIAEDTKPAAILVLNIMRDQLDRYGEIDKTAAIIGKSFEFSEKVILNYDDPPVAELGNIVAKTTYFGTTDKIKVLLPSDRELLGKQAKKSTNKPKNVILTTINQVDTGVQLVINVNGENNVIKTKLEGVHNYVNMTAAISAFTVLRGALSGDVIEAISNIEPAFGRGERLKVEGVDVHLALVKNPSGFNQNIRAFLNDHVGLVLFLINDKYADGRDVSWLWDIDLTKLHKWKGLVLTSGVRGLDMSLRLQYENIDTDSLDPDIAESLKQAIASVQSGKEILILPTYTAMLEARKVLSKHAKLKEIWR